MMAISNAQMIKRMEQELYLAKVAADEQTMHRHLGHVRLLCDILLDENPTLQTENQTATKIEPNAHISETEMKAMMGSTTKQIRANDKPQDSIFDF